MRRQHARSLHLTRRNALFGQALAYAYSPSLAVIVNGSEVTPIETSGGFIAIPLQAGRQHIVLEARMSPLRKTLLGIDVLFLVAAIALAWRARKKRG